MTATKAPTPGPLSASDIAHVRDYWSAICDSDWHLIPANIRDDLEERLAAVGLAEWRAVTDDDLEDTFAYERGIEKGRSCLDLTALGHLAFKSDADGWMPWSGGENPVPGQRVQWRTRNETDRVMSVLSNNLDWTHECRRGFDPIIAFRLAPTAPVEASGSEREITIKVGDDRIGPWRIWFDPPPIGARNCDWHYQHEDDDGSRGWMSGSCATREDCLEEIITQYEERGS